MSYGVGHRCDWDLVFVGPGMDVKTQIHPLALALPHAVGATLKKKKKKDKKKMVS